MAERSWAARWARWWELHPPVVVIVGAPRAVAFETLARAIRPSTDRLHLRDLFMEGRRYYLQAEDRGFRLTSDTRRVWGSRKVRTGRTALIIGTLASDADAVPTLIYLRARMFGYHMLRALILPVVIGALILGVGWWPLPLRLSLILVIAALSWIGHRADAALQAHAMMVFIQKALEHLPPGDLPALDEGMRPDVIAGATDAPSAFGAAWERFYQQHQTET